jgi:transposase
MREENSVPQQRLIRAVNRQQMCWRAVDVERLIDEDHLARSIWSLVGRLDLRHFYEKIESSAEEGGRPAFDPQMLISVWVYAYSQGIGAAREVARRCEYDPAFQWLTGLQEVNYHTLADFRVERQAELDELFTQVLGALSQEGLITLEQVTQDGTKIRASASGRSFRQEESIRQHLERARQHVKEMSDPEKEEGIPRLRGARKCAREQRERRLEKALEEVQKLRPAKPVSAEKMSKVSLTDPEARYMKQPDGGLAPSYNVQISTDAAHSLIVGVEVVNEAEDSAQLLPAFERIEERLKKKPQQIVADGSYTTREAIEQTAEREIDFLGSLGQDLRGSGITVPQRPLAPSAFVYEAESNRMRCPEGKWLNAQSQRSTSGAIAYRYEARAEDCLACGRKPQCCPENQKRGRSVQRVEESAVVRAFREKMASAAAQQQYRRRAQVAEFCHAWIKSKLGLRQFHVRGRVKARAEALWACLTYNLHNWIRLQRSVAQGAQ